MRLTIWWLVVIAMFWAFASGSQGAEIIDVSPNQPVIDISKVVQVLPGNGNRVVIEAAPDQEGIVRKIEVRSISSENVIGWLIFTLKNSGDVKIDKLLVIPHYRLQSSGLFSPDLGAKRLISLSSSQGVKPREQAEIDDDAFLITIDPGATVSFIGELASTKLPQVSLWNPQLYNERINDAILFNGILVGITGLLSVVISILFVVRASLVFPVTAIISWSILGYLLVQFNMWDKFLEISDEQIPFYRVVTEIAWTMSFGVFLLIYLDIPRPLLRKGYVILGWLFSVGLLVFLALINQSLVVSVTRGVLLIICLAGFILIVSGALKHNSSAITLLPTWMLFTGWVGLYFFTLTGQITGGLAEYGVFSGLVIIITLLGFTVMQHIFSSLALISYGVFTTQQQALALIGAGWKVWDWIIESDKVSMSPSLAKKLVGVNSKRSIRIHDWLTIIYPGDRDGFKIALDTLIQKKSRRFHRDVTIRDRSGKYLVFNMRISTVMAENGDVVRCIGTITNVTRQRNRKNRMAANAFYDDLTGLAGRGLFLDRLNMAILRARSQVEMTPVVFLINIDHFDGINQRFGESFGDSVLLTVSHRLDQLLHSQDTLARISNDNFAIILEITEQLEQRISIIVDSVRKVLAATITFMDREVDITTSVGVSIYQNPEQTGEEILKTAELAMLNAKFTGNGQVANYDISLREYGASPSTLAKELQIALSQNEFELEFVPIIGLKTQERVGFTGQFYWVHPRFGKISSTEIYQLAKLTNDETAMISYLLTTISKITEGWRRDQIIDLPVFVSLNNASNSLLTPEFLSDVYDVIDRCKLGVNNLVLSIPQRMITSNPEVACYILKNLNMANIRLAINGFDGSPGLFEIMAKYQFKFIEITKELAVRSLDPQRSALLTTIINIAKELEIAVIAKGLDDGDWVQRLIKVGCEYGQGEAFGRPMQVSEIEREAYQNVS